MDNQKQSFLNAILGENGASALIKAADRSPALEYALVPRAILGWVQSAPRYEGIVPGIEGTAISFEKSEAGFTGSVDIGDKLYKFEGASVFYVAASIGVAIGVENREPPEELRDFDIQALGKTIDTLAKVKRVGKELKKGFYSGYFGGGDIGPGTAPGALKTGRNEDKADALAEAGFVGALPIENKFSPTQRGQAKNVFTQVQPVKEQQPHLAGTGSHTPEAGMLAGALAIGHGVQWLKNLRVKSKMTKTELAKAKEPGGNAAAPMAPTAPLPPTAVAPQQPKSTPTKLPKLPASAGAKPPKPVTAAKPVGVKLTRSEVEHNCPSCGLKQFNGKQFTGCVCFRALSKSVKVLGSNPTGTLLEFDMKVWDREGILTLLESVGRKV